MEAATRQGRAAGSVATAVVAPAYVGDDIAHQREQLRWFGGMVGNHVADLVKRYGENTPNVPKVLTDYIKDRADYDYSHHGRAGNPSTDFVPDDIVDRFCVLGRVEAHIEKLTTLRDTGTDHFAIYLMHDSEEETLDAYGRSILPVLTGTASARSPYPTPSTGAARPRPAHGALRSSHGASSGDAAATGRRAGSTARRGARPSGDGRAAGDWHSAASADYERKGFSSRSGFGTRPALLIVDFINGFTDPGTGLGGEYGAELAVTAKLLDEFRSRALPVFFTTVAYEPHLRDGGQFVAKVPALSILVKGTEWVKVDDRIRPRPSEQVVLKKYASAFFDTRLEMELRGLGVDTVVIVGCTTSGCIRASAIDSMQNGFRTVVVRDAVGDRAETPHEVNLFDIDAKYGDVVSSGEVLEYLRGLGRSGGLGATADDEFQRWWNRAPAR